MFACSLRLSVLLGKFRTTLNTAWNTPYSNQLHALRLLARNHLTALKAYLQPTSSISVDPITVILFLSEFDPNTVTPSVADARWALQCALMVRPPITLTLVRKQYQPFGFKSSIFVPPMTLTPGLTMTKDGELVISESIGSFPIPKTLTDVASVLYWGLFPKGCSPQTLRQFEMEPPSSVANVGTLNSIATPKIIKSIDFSVLAILFSFGFH